MAKGLSVNDMKEIEEMVKRYNSRLYRIIHHFTYQAQQTEDIIQEVWLKVVKYYSRFRRQSNIFTWLYRIAVNTAITYLKKNPVLQDYPESPDKRNTFQPEAEYEKNLLRYKINKAVLKLKKNQKEVFIMRTYEELPYSKIACRLNISVNNAKTTYFYALQKIKKELKDELS